MAAEGYKKISVLLIGTGSMLGQALLAVPQEALSFTGIAHSAFDPQAATAYDIVINMAYDPRYMREAYNSARDFDLRVAEAVADGRGHFFMMSTRKVYGPARETPLAEDAPKAPVDHYGCNKLETEGRVQALLGSRCTILRLANVFDFEPNRHTFLGIALTTLKREGRIVLDVNPFVKRDFIPLPDCLAAILSILPQKPAGVINIGYGTATEIGRVSLWLIEGYGRGELVVNSTEERDAFVLDIGRLTALIGASATRKSIRDRCLEIGKRLRDA